MKKLSKLSVYVGLLALVTLLVGCSSNSKYSSNDIMFAEMMIPHHEQAIEMSELALSKSTNPEIIKLATQIKGAQTPEIELMKSWEGVDASMHMGHTMMGMLDDQEIADLKAASGAQFDRLFLEGMIKHHEGAIDMAGMIEDSKNKEVADLGKAIIQAQTEEIEVMQDLLKRLS